MLADLMQLVRQLVCAGDLMLARTMRKKVIEKCEYFRQKHETSQHVTLLPSYQLTVKYQSTTTLLLPLLLLLLLLLLLIHGRWYCSGWWDVGLVIKSSWVQLSVTLLSSGYYLDG